MVLSTSNQIVEAERIENREVVLVLGTSRYIADGQENPYFSERIATAAKLFHERKVNHILVSGDNGTKYYNEPRQMQEALIEMDIAPDHITLDYAGFRTLDSIVRAKEVFGRDSVVIVTQRFHAYRSLFLANNYGLHAQAVTAGSNERSNFKLLLREYLARTLAVIDVYILHRQPKFF